MSKVLVASSDKENQAPVLGKNSSSIKQPSSKRIISSSDDDQGFEQESDAQSSLKATKKMPSKKRTQDLAPDKESDAKRYKVELSGPDLAADRATPPFVPATPDSESETESHREERQEVPETDLDDDDFVPATPDSQIENYGVIGDTSDSPSQTKI